MDLRELPRQAFARHPWETVRADFFLGVLRDHVTGSGLRALDLGAGDGYLARRLRAELPAVAEITCLDTGYDDAWMAAQREPGLRFVAETPPGPFDVVLLLDVLEHADDDAGLLASAVAATAPGGVILLSVPAYPLLFSRHDQRLGHRRRYAPVTLRRLAEQAGLSVVTSGQLFGSLILPRALARLGELAGPRASTAPAPDHVETPLGTWHHGPMVTRAVHGLLALDAAAGGWAARRGWPWPGLSTWLLARRP